MKNVSPIIIKANGVKDYVLFACLPTSDTIFDAKYDSVRYQWTAQIGACSEGQHTRS